MGRGSSEMEARQGSSADSRDRELRLRIRVVLQETVKAATLNHLWNKTERFRQRESQSRLDKTYEQCLTCRVSGPHSSWEPGIVVLNYAEGGSGTLSGRGVASWGVRRMDMAPGCAPRSALSGLMTALAHPSPVAKKRRTFPPTYHMWKPRRLSPGHRLTTRTKPHRVQPEYPLTAPGCPAGQKEDGLGDFDMCPASIIRDQTTPIGAVSATYVVIADV
ncbi:unnamed protein product [Pleuronectes platessa]|uniref:Uncharacterized protein n=1 Tax=Pleuronectes platessa TaxID=8262 RepID=A0A9N7UF67_PLEPL|nr:unnamed protein product [Pleuronectes platessa]